MSNPLASAEARQAAEKIAREVYSVYFLTLSADEQSKQIIDPLAAIIAESYADLVRRLEEAEQWANKTITDREKSLKYERDCMQSRAEAAESDMEAAESLNRQLVAQLQVLRDAKLGHAYFDHEGETLSVEQFLAEAAINSATPKQGEGNK